MDSLLAARLQMTISLAFHMVFAATGIGLPLLLVIVERAYLRSGDEQLKRLAQKWSKVTGLLFAVGAVSGTALSLELGLLWPAYMEVLGAAVGHLFGLEGFAFFVEAIFIGLYLYGWDRLNRVTHWWCGVVIAISGALSGILVLGVNAWMQLPVGVEMSDGVVTSTRPLEIFTRPLWLHMAIHSTLSCYIAVAFAVASWYALQTLRGRRDNAAYVALISAMVVGGVSALLQPISGDLLAKYVFRTQPVKFAAMEGQFRTERGAPLRIGGWPDEQRQTTDYAIEIPGGLSYLATGDFSAEVQGLDQVPRPLWPNVGITHAAFQIMVGCGTLLIAATLFFWITWFRTRRNVLENRWLMRALLASGPLGFLALEAGWFVTEVGRQPWVIQGIMRTRDAVTPAKGVEATFYAFTIMYVLLAVTVVILLRKLSKAPQPEST